MQSRGNFSTSAFAHSAVLIGLLQGCAVAPSDISLTTSAIPSKVAQTDCVRTTDGAAPPASCDQTSAGRIANLAPTAGSPVRPSEPRPAGNAPFMLPELTVGFEGESVTLDIVDRQAIVAAATKHKAAGRKSLRLYGGAGGSGNPFDKLVIAQKRMRFVSGLLPQGMLLKAEYDPNQTTDTIRIEFEN